MVPDCGDQAGKFQPALRAVGPKRLNLFNPLRDRTRSRHFACLPLSGRSFSGIKPLEVHCAQSAGGDIHKWLRLAAVFIFVSSRSNSFAKSFECANGLFPDASDGRSSEFLFAPFRISRTSPSVLGFSR